MKAKYGKIKSIEEVINFECGNQMPMTGNGGASLGFSAMVASLSGIRDMDGYKVEAAKGTVLVLIDNQQSCCENWGYMASDDDLSSFVGATLRDIELTDKRLETWSLTDDQKKSEEDRKKYGWKEYEEGGIQFVTFKTSHGDFQLAVYNGHNGFYGHGIIVAVDGKIIHQDTL